MDFYRRQMRSWLRLARLTSILTGALAVGFGCGGGGPRSVAGASRLPKEGGAASASPAGDTRRATVSSPPAAARRDDDGDRDNRTHAHYDADDYAVLDFGHAADPADSRAVTELVEGYYAAAAAGDGEKTCSLLYSLQVELIAEEDEQGGRRSRSEAEACAAAMANTLRVDHAQLAAEAAHMEVLRVRTQGDRGEVLLRVGVPPERHVLVRREHGAWRMYVEFAITLP